MNSLRMILAALFLLNPVLITGCSASTSTANEQAALPAAPTATLPRSQTATPATTATPTPPATATPTDSAQMITIWLVEPVSPQAEGEAGQFIANTLRRFELDNPDIEVNMLVKKSSGKGGVLDFLRTAKEVAPTVLPDVVLMNATDLYPASTEQLIQPLDGKLDRAIVQDLLPAARRVGTVNEQLVGVPLGLEMEHTVYNTAVFTQTTIVWSDVLSQSRRFLFPARGVNGIVNDLTLAEYFSVGGRLVSEEGDPKIDEQQLREVLSFYEQMLANGNIDASLLDASTTEELWPQYLAGQAALAQISVRQYLTDRDQLNATAVTGPPLSNIADTPVSMMHAWTLALVTADPARQDAALRLLETFLSTDNNAAWNDLNKSIPVRDTAYQELAGDDPYWVFLTTLLNTARPEPRFPGYDRVGRILQQALEQVLSGEATAEQATTTAVDALAQ